MDEGLFQKHQWLTTQTPIPVVVTSYKSIPVHLTDSSTEEVLFLSNEYYCYSSGEGIPNILSFLNLMGFISFHSLMILPLPQGWNISTWIK